MPTAVAPPTDGASQAALSAAAQPRRETSDYHRMREQLDFLHKVAAAGQRSCWCRVIETRGSTPQKAGAAMIVLADGSQAGTLGGGCVEAEVKRAAVAAIAHGRSHCKQFLLDNDYGWDDGLICGGRMTVLLQPAGASEAGSYFTPLRELVSQGEGFTEAVELPDSDQSSGTEATDCGGAWLFDTRRQLVAALPDEPQQGDQSQRVAAELVPLEQRPKPYRRGDFAYLPVMPRCRLVIVGGGHVGQAVAELAAELDFDVCVIDDRADVVSAERFPRAQQRIAGKFDDVLPSLEITPHTYCLIVTRGHNHDEEALFHLINRQVAYLGMIGSRRKIRLIYDDLLDQGISQQALDCVHAPVGLAIGSQTVPEIAVSIAAELIAHRNLKASQQDK